MTGLIRKVIAILLTVTAFIVAVIPAGSADATTTHGEYEYDGSTIVKYIGDDSVVTLPNWVTKVGKEAFSENKKLTKVIIPDSVREIDYSAFNECTNLQIVVLPESVRTIGSSAFSGCTSLYSISLPAKLSSLGSGVFAGCTSLSDVPIDSSNEYYYCRDGVIYTKDGKEIVQYLAGRPFTSFSMNSSINKIDEYSFWGSNELSDVSISGNVTKIPEYSFAYCKGLKKIVLPYSVETINAYAFADCSNLEYINIPESVGFIDDRAFYMTYGTKIRLVDSNGNIIKEFNSEDVSAYGNGTDESAPVAPKSKGNTVSSLTQATGSAAINNAVEDNNTDSDVDNDSELNKKTYNGSFSGDDSWITEIDNTDYSLNSVPGEIGSTKIIGGNAVVMFPSSTPIQSGFDLNEAEEEDNYSLSTGTYWEDSQENVVFNDSYIKYNGSSSSLDIPDNCSSIGSRALYKNNTLTNVTIPQGVELIDNFAFARSVISNVALPESLKTIKYGAFYNCASLDNVKIPAGVNRIELGTFNGTKWLEDWKRDETSNDYLIVGDGILLSYKGHNSVVDIPSSVKYISAGAFSGNEDIKSVTIPGTVIRIDEEAFNNCRNLTSLKLNEGLKNIEDRAFRNTSLTALSIPDSVETIGLGAFDTTGNKSTLNCVIISGIDLPNVSYNETASRLSAKDLRKRAFAGVQNVIIDSSCDISSGNILNPVFLGFAGQVYAVDSPAEKTLMLIQATLEPDSNGTVSINPRVKIGNDLYIMDNVKNNAFEYYKSWNLWCNNRPSGITVDGNASDDLNILLDTITSQINDASGVGNGGINVIYDNDLSFSNSFGYGTIPDNNDRFNLLISKGNEYKDQLTSAYYEKYHSYPGANTVYLNLDLYDKSMTIPIHKVGNNKVEITLSVPNSLKGSSDLGICCLDDHGMINELTSQTSSENGDEVISFVTSHFSPYMIYNRSNIMAPVTSQYDSIDVSIDNSYQENGMNIQQKVVKTLNKEVSGGIEVKWFIVIILLCISGILVLYKPLKRKK